MRALISTLLLGLLFFGAIWAAPYIYNNPGYVMISVGKGYVEMTLLTLLLCLIGFYILGKVLIFSVSRVLRLGKQTQLYFFNKSELKAQQALRQGLTAFLLGDYQRSEKLLSGAGKRSGLIESKHMFAAAAADASGEEGKMLVHLNALDEDDLDTNMLKAKLLANRRQWTMALELMAPLYQKKPKDDGVFSLYVDVLHGNEDWTALLELLPLIEKRKGLTESEFIDFATHVVSKALMSTARLQTFEQAQQLFNQLPGKLKKQDYAVSAYVELLLANGKGSEAESVLLKAMKKSSVAAYLPLFRKVKFDQVIELNKYLQTLLKKDESDRDLLTAIGYIAAGRSDWSLVTKVLSRTVGPDSKAEDLKTLANAYCELGDSQNAVKVYQKLQD